MDDRIEDSFQAGEPPPVVAEPPVVTEPPRKGWATLSWLVILLAVCGIPLARLLLSAAAEEKAERPAVMQRLDLRMTELQVKMLVGIAQHMPPGEQKGLYEGVADEAKDDLAKRLRVVPVAGELVGPEEALSQLEQFDRSVEQAGRKPTPEQEKARAILGRLYADYSAGQFDHPSVTDAELDWLVEEIGWVARLARHPPQGADDAARQEVLDEAAAALWVAVGGVVGGFTLLAVGFVGLVLFLFLWAGGYLHVGLPRGVPHGGVYAETFALWLVAYLVLTLVGGVYLADLPLMSRGIVAMLASLGVVFWPVVRGVPWSQVRHDIGWTLGRQPLLEPLYGVVVYVINLPVVFAGFLATLVLVLIQALLSGQLQGAGDGEPPPPTHPILGEFGNRDWFGIVQIFFLLSVVAPIVEETFFRGVLHRHLREVRWIRSEFLSGLFSAVVVSVVFAAVHPQGLAFIPVLASLAMGFSVAREWRGSLIPCMVAHGMSNFLVGMLGMWLTG